MTKRSTLRSAPFCRFFYLIKEMWGTTKKPVSKITPCLFSLPYLELKQMNWLDRCTNRRKYQLGDKKDQQKLISLTLYNEYFHLALILV